MGRVQELSAIDLILSRRLIEEDPLHTQTRNGILAPIRVGVDILQYSFKLPLGIARCYVANGPYISVAVETWYFPHVVSIRASTGSRPAVRIHHNGEFEAGLTCDSFVLSAG